MGKRIAIVAVVVMLLAQLFVFSLDGKSAMSTSGATALDRTGRPILLARTLADYQLIATALRLRIRFLRGGGASPSDDDDGLIFDDDDGGPYVP